MYSGNGDITCRQTDEDKRRRHLERFPPIGGEIQTSHQKLQHQAVISSQLSGRLHLLHLQVALPPLLREC
ncbi:hypothetical protein E3U43_010373%2C partial [Xyrichtys novacula]|uniref:Uncharacterized protein n=1 Tax=Xyrichtys novacula TaxID=13765 RepID=A0AAV1HCA9_XYRNO|nr:hypothetical protein E3U43_010373%2C partial [Xyrichtys novacula]